LHKKSCCDQNFGESLCIFTFFHFPDSGLYLLTGFDFDFDLFWIAWHWKPAIVGYKGTWQKTNILLMSVWLTRSPQCSSKQFCPDLIFQRLLSSPRKRWKDKSRNHGNKFASEINWLSLFASNGWRCFTPVTKLLRCDNVISVTHSLCSTTVPALFGKTLKGLWAGPG